MFSKLAIAVPFGITDEDRVLWVRGQDIKFEQPMFRDAIWGARTSGTADAVIQTDFASLIKTASQLDEVVPAGLIFHVGRCGSTLLSNALRAVNGTLVLSEPGFLGSLLKRHVNNKNLLSPQQNQENTALLQKSFITILGAAAPNHENGVYLKFASWSSLLLEQIQLIWPNTPIAFAFREPLDVLDSILAKRIGWMKFYNTPGFVSGLLNEGEDSLKDLPFINFAVKVLTEIYKSGLKLTDDDLLISYGNNRMDNIEKLLAHFNLRASAADQLAIAESTRYYSKDRRKQRLFTENENTRKYILNHQTKALIDASGIHQIYQTLGKFS
ncbi:MAG: hypothetical protein JWQ79_2814 [Mucilaginibacter sp.]|nr:hypothetical protein [Mucilaginibacter sp.]